MRSPDQRRRSLIPHRRGPETPPPPRQLIVLLVALLLAAASEQPPPPHALRNRPAGHGGRGSGQPPGGVTRAASQQSRVDLLAEREAIELQIQQLDASQQSLTQQLAALAMQIRHLPR